MKKATQILFLFSVCLSALAQQPITGAHKRISSTSDLIARLKKDLPQDLKSSRTESPKPACIVDSIINKYWSSGTNSPLISSKEEYAYNLQYNIFLKKKYNWNSFSQSWSNYSKNNLTYDSHDNLLNELSLSASTQGTNTVWNNSGNTIYTYDNNNNQTSSIYQYWNSQSNSWKTSSASTSTYNTNNLITQEIYQSASSFTAPLVNAFKYTYAYDIFNNPLLFQEYEWNSVTNAWDIVSKYNITASGNKITAYVGYDWDATTNSWINSVKGSMTYDASGNQTSQTEQSWNTVTNSWVNEYKSTYTYDANHNMLSSTDQNWNTGTNVWENSSQILYTYNSNNYETIQLQLSWNASGNSWKNSHETDTYYNCHNVGLSEESLSGSSFVIYPNPAQSELTIKSEKEFTSVTILNINGQIVFESQNTHTLNISTLEKGIYFVQLQDKNKTVLQTQKFVKE